MGLIQTTFGGMYSMLTNDDLRKKRRDRIRLQFEKESNNQNVSEVNVGTKKEVSFANTTEEHNMSSQDSNTGSKMTRRRKFQE